MQHYVAFLFSLPYNIYIILGKDFSPMTAPKTDRRILRTRALLRQGLAELMQEKNAGDITVKGLVAHANVNRSTFYLHYTDIDQMLASVEAELLERI